MALYLTIRTGARPEDAQPILALGDQRLIRQMLALVPQTLGGGVPRDADEPQRPRRVAPGGRWRHKRTRSTRSTRPPQHR